MRFHLRYLLVRNVQSEFLFALGKRYPQPAPGREAVVVGKYARHFGGSVSGYERIFVDVFHIISRAPKNLSAL